jgi:hypothetical protein
MGFPNVQTDVRQEGGQLQRRKGKSEKHALKAPKSPKQFFMTRGNERQQ